MTKQNILDWLIKKLGGVTKSQQEEFRNSCEGFAKKYLKCEGKILSVPNTRYSYEYLCDDVTIISSRVGIYDCTLSSVKIAPWCNDVIISGIVIKEKVNDQHSRPNSARSNYKQTNGLITLF